MRIGACEKKITATKAELAWHQTSCASSHRSIVCSPPLPCTWPALRARQALVMLQVTSWTYDNDNEWLSDAHETSAPSNLLLA